MTFIMTVEAPPIKGKRAKRQKEKIQPLVKAIVIPEMQRPTDITSWPNLSPMALSIESVSVDILEESS
jgi:hypothetical protein